MLPDLASFEQTPRFAASLYPRAPSSAADLSASASGSAGRASAELSWHDARAGPGSGKGAGAQKDMARTCAKKASAWKAHVTLMLTLMLMLMLIQAHPQAVPGGLSAPRPPQLRARPLMPGRSMKPFVVVRTLFAGGLRASSGPALSAPEARAIHSRLLPSARTLGSEGSA